MEIELYEIRALDEFRKEIERLTKKKRFFSLPAQIGELFEKFKRGQIEGDRIKHIETPVACDVYKLRLPNSDAKVGKSNGYRVIYLVVTEAKIIVFMVLYYKKEYASVPDDYIDGLIDGCLLSLAPEDRQDMQDYSSSKESTAPGEQPA